MLVRNGAAINSLTSDGWTPLMTAAFKGNPELVRYLLDEGADSSLKNQEGKTALDIAGSANNTEIINMLKDVMLCGQTSFNYIEYPGPPRHHEERYADWVGKRKRRRLIW